VTASQFLAQPCSRRPGEPCDHKSRPVAAEQATETGGGQAERDHNEPPPVFRRQMLYPIQLSPRFSQPTPTALGVFDKTVYRFDSRHADVHRRHPEADLGTEMVAGDDCQQQRLVADHQMRLAAERRSKARDRRLNLRGVGSVQE